MKFLLPGILEDPGTGDQKLTWIWILEPKEKERSDEADWKFTWIGSCLVEPGSDQLRSKTVRCMCDPVLAELRKNNKKIS